MDKVQLIQTEANELLSKIIDNVDIEVSEDHGVYHVLVKAEDEAPTIIGRHGETIKAIQKILEVVMYKKTGESVELLVNVNDYREKQTEKQHSVQRRPLSINEEPCTECDRDCKGPDAVDREATGSLAVHRWSGGIRRTDQGLDHRRSAP